MSLKIILAAGNIPDGRMFALDKQTIISASVQLINFLILAAVLGFMLYKPVQNYLRRRAEKISGQFDEAQKKEAKASELKEEYERKLKEISAERAEILEEARMEAAERSRLLVEEARTEAEHIKKRAGESAKAEEERLKKEAWRYIVEISTMMAEKLVFKTIDADAHDKLFEEALAELEGSSWPR